MQKGNRVAAVAFGLAGIAGVAWAGGQQLKAEVGADGRSIVVRTYRCGTPSTLALAGTAEGIVAGQRRTIELQVPLASAEGVFSVPRQWPSEGAWVLSFTLSGNRGASTLVELAPGATLKIRSQESTYEKPTARRIEAALRASR
jgi:hypothetical protein